MADWSSTGYLTISTGLAPGECDCSMCTEVRRKKGTSMPISTTPADAIAELAHQLGKDTDLSSVKNAFDNLEAEKRGRIEKALDGAVATAAIEKPTSRRFRLIYFAQDKITTLYGTAYEGAEDYKADEDGILKVHVQTSSYLLCENYRSMKALHKRLDDQKAP